LNVDLEIGARTRAELAPLIEALEGKLFELFRGRIGGLYRMHYEVSGPNAGADATIRALVAAIDALPPTARRAWANAAMRDFNVGVELASGERCVELAIDAETVQRVAALAGRIAFTAYPAAPMAAPRKKRAKRRS
jgi:hypothetical protein